MAVKILTQEQKDAIVTIYRNKAKSIKEMAQWLEVSERTVVRVLNQAGYLTEKQLEVEKLKQAANKLVSREQIVKVCMNMEEGTWAALLADIVKARVAKASNTHVQTAMLNIEQKVNKNVR